MKFNYDVKETAAVLDTYPVLLIAPSVFATG